MLKTDTRRVGVFIDVQNMYYSARNIHNQKVNFENIVSEAVGDQLLVRTRAFTISTKDGDETAFFDALRKSGIEVVSKELLEYNSGAKKGDWDVGITIDIVSMLDMLDVVVLVSGDGDFVPLCEYVKSRGRIFHVASFRESTSTSLVNAASKYTNLSDDKETYLIGSRKKSTGTSKPKTKAKPAEKEKTKTKTPVKSKAKPKSKARPAKRGRRSAPKASTNVNDKSSEEDIEESRTRRLTF
jgi:uncharacterized LabA/DUF88 family protein